MEDVVEGGAVKKPEGAEEGDQTLGSEVDDIPASPKVSGTVAESTPSKKAKATPKGTPKGKKVKAEGDDTDATPKVKARASTISTSKDTLSDVDKMILRMRDDEHKSWTEINEAWQKATGKVPGKSTLTVRYGRIKANITQMPQEDVSAQHAVPKNHLLIFSQEERLIKFKKDAEAKFEVEKWAQIATMIEGDGGAKYSTAALQKKVKDLVKKQQGAAADTGLASSSAAADGAGSGNEA